MKKNMKKLLSSVTGAAMLTGGAVQAATAEIGYEVKVNENVASYSKVAHVNGDFYFEQDAVTPADEVFNLFGTVSTAMCARPNFAFETGAGETRFVNIGGSVRRAQTLSMADIQGQGSETKILKCSCATGSAIANAQITGVPLSNILQLVDLEEGTNTVTFTGTDGYSVSLPLTYALEKNAMLVYQVEGTPIPTGTQVWVPQAVARYFTRSLADVEFSIQEKVPEILTADASQRAKVSIMNRFDDTVFTVGDQIEFEGYADDFNKTIAAIEYSMDGGETWSSFATRDTDPNKWVYWHFAYTTEAPGTYKLDVRARTEDGTVSPLASSVIFTVASKSKA
ncbi:MAG TPA: molybdopterin-binding protein [Erysipelotrichaceae bacterium]|nr:molybdopterin-binding protein [Erysipelotrichaceae bacterium]